MYTDTFFFLVVVFFKILFPYACLPATPGEVISKSGEFKVLIWSPANNKLNRYRQLFSLHFKTKAQDFLRVVCAKKELKSGIPLTIGIRNPSSSDVNVRVKLSNLSLLI